VGERDTTRDPAQTNQNIDHIGSWIKMNVRPINTEADYNAALSALSRLVDLDPVPGTSDGNLLDLLTTAVQDFKNARFPFPPPVQSATSG
jgi:antitoxin component HigA of HigAB toxin-antitoxin module